MSVRILIVDDHAVVRRGVRALLEAQQDYEICGEATTGREAITLAAQLRPDLVVIDLSLPELNGLDATREILKDSPHTQVLVLTMHHSEDLARDVLHAGARGYVLKSDADEDLVTAVETLRKNKPFFSSAVTDYLVGDYMRLTQDRDAALPRDHVTPRERELIQLIAAGLSNKEAAVRLGVSTKTVETHRANIMRKLRLRSVSDLVRYAVRNKLVEP